MAKGASDLRAEAREYRALAEHLGGTAMRQAMDDVAASCDRMADALEDEGSSDQGSKPGNKLFEKEAVSHWLHTIGSAAFVLPPTVATA